MAFRERDILKNKNDIQSIENRLSNLKKQIDIPITDRMPVRAQGNNGDIMLGNIAGTSMMFCKIKDSWKAVKLAEPSVIYRRVGPGKWNSINVNWFNNSRNNHDSGWFGINDSNDTNLIDTTSNKGRYEIKHNLNSELVTTTMFCRFEALSDGEIKEYTIDLSSHISHPGPNQSRTGYWVNIIDNNTIELYIHPDGLSIIYGEALKDSNSNTSMLLSSYDTSTVGSVELRVIVASVLESNGSKTEKNKTSRGNILSSLGGKRTITGNTVSGDKGAAVDGTKNSSFKIDSDGTGVLLKNDSGILKVRNLGDTADAEINASKVKLSSTSPGQGEIGVDSNSDHFIRLSDGSNTYFTVIANASGVVQGTPPGSALVLLDSNFLIADGAGSAGSAQFSTNSVTAGDTRTMTIPDADGTLALTTDPGTILGYTRLQGDLTNQSSFEIQNSLTVEDDTHKVTFTTPPSEKVEIEATFAIDVRSTDTRLDIALSTANATSGYASVAEQFEYDGVVGISFSDDEVNDDSYCVKWVLEAAQLASVGSSNTFWIAFSTAGSTKTAYLYYGLRASHGSMDMPFIIKATALPATIYDGT